ncbi:hypothetical protein DRW07_10110 [Alteromonas sediminis]|uniref:Uncharacterized protein n=1 Tax=Alteromonas sediminis TaxID=2259342 RepID=A0A3N5Y080_9ALTE|nr:hypothetical protein [Alteromonas sediminis]RPJ66440.1 hypothetical protein DRW07_10110 [Alteromonas sediminis]
MQIILPLLVGGILFSSTAVASDSLAEAAKKAVNCSNISDADARLACFDAASKRLSALLAPEMVAKPAETPVKPTTPVKPAPARTETVAAKPDVKKKAESIEEETLPTWASGPRHTEEERKQDSDDFTATIVRITSNNLGRHRFYTEDGAVWEQTQLVKVRKPRSLPAVAEFRRKMTGNPVISFENSGRSYRVRRIK